MNTVRKIERRTLVVVLALMQLAMGQTHEWSRRARCPVYPVAATRGSFADVSQTNSGAAMWFRRKHKAEPAEAVRSLREQALQVSAAKLNIVPMETHREVWGVLMETGYPEAVATLVVLADGTTGLYFSNGGGVIGAGEHAKVRIASGAILSATARQLAEFAPAQQTPLPPAGSVRFLHQDIERPAGADAREQELGEGRHVLSPVFSAAHNVIAAVRESSGVS